MNGTGGMGTVFALAAMLAACDRVPAEAEAEGKSAAGGRAPREKVARSQAAACADARRADLELFTSAA